MFLKLQKWIQGGDYKSEIFRGGIGSFFLRITYSLLTFGITVFLARLMGVENFGNYSYILAIIMVLAIPAQFGLPTLFVRETAQSLSRKEWSEIRGIWQWGGRITLGLTAVITFSTLFVLFLFNDHFDQTQINTMLWGLALVPFITLSALRGAALRGLHKVVLGQLPEQLFLPGIFLFLILVSGYILKVAINPSLAMILQVSAAVIAFFLGAILLIRHAPKEIARAMPITKNKQWLSSTFSLALISGMNIINKWVSILILGLFVTPAEVGIYRVAVQMAVLTDFGLQIINPVIGPQIARLHARGDKKGLQRLASATARVVLFFNLVITAGFIFFGRPFLKAFFGVEYVASYNALLLLLIGQTINSLAGSVGIILNMTGYEKDTARARIIATVVNIALNFILSPLLGILGAAVASATSLILWNVMLWLQVRKRLGINSLAFGKGIYS